MATIDIMLDELQTYRAALDVPLEGFRDYTHLNLTEAAKPVAVQGVDVYSTARAQAMAAIEVLESLAAKGFPALPRFTVTAEVKADFDANKSTIAAADGQVDVEAPSATHIETTFTISDQP